MRTAVLLVFAMLAGPVFAAASGRVVGPDGVPVAGAEVCELVEGAPEQCVTADSQGFYRMEKPSRSSLLVRARGFVPKVVDAVPLNAPVELHRAAVLLVTVVDAVTGQPLSSGRVMIDDPSGRRIGDFVPFNKSGVRISTLGPGPVFVRVEADGYQSGGPVPVDLIGGTERALKIPMAKSDGTSR